MHSLIDEADKAMRESDRGSKSNYRAGKVLSLSDIIYHTEDNDASIEGAEREDSDYDDELELDFETSIATEDVDSDVLPTNLNLRIHRRHDEIDRPNGSFGVSCENDYQVLIVSFTLKCFCPILFQSPLLFTFSLICLCG